MNAFVFPSSDFNEKIKNPYINDLIQSIEQQNGYVINKGIKGKFGIFDSFFYLKSTDVIFLNWVENIPSSGFGTLQTFLFIALFFLYKIFNVKTVWIAHNKISHKPTKLKELLCHFLYVFSDVMVTHSSEGVLWYTEKFGIRKKSTHFIHHPIKERILEQEVAKTIDILIWGSMQRYKGIKEFVELINQKNIENLKIVLVGYFSDKHYYEEILGKNQLQNLEIRNDFLDFDELGKLINQSRVTLFPYKEDSILSSGVLMDTLSFGGFVLGPNSGAFKDLAEEGIVEVYKDLSEYLDAYKCEGIQISSEYKSNLKLFVEKNTWECLL